MEHSLYFPLASRKPHPKPQVAFKKVLQQHRYLHLWFFCQLPCFKLPLKSPGLRMAYKQGKRGRLIDGLNKTFQNKLHPFWVYSHSQAPKCRRNSNSFQCNLEAGFDVGFIRDLKIRGRRRQRKRRWKSGFAFFQSLSRLLQVTNFVKCRRTLLKLNS